MIKPVTDGAAITTLALVFASVLTPIATLFTIIWMGIRIYETETVQRFIGRLKRKEP